MTFLLQFYRTFGCIQYVTIENNYIPLTIIMRNNRDVIVTREAIPQYCSSEEEQPGFPPLRLGKFEGAVVPVQGSKS